ncbi:MAG: 6-phosphofructokinase [Merdibacter sp.]
MIRCTAAVQSCIRRVVRNFATISVERGKGLPRDEIDGLVVIGGDGSFSARGFIFGSLVSLFRAQSTTILLSDYTVGFDTAVNTVMMVDKLRGTSQSHDRCSIVE